MIVGIDGTPAVREHLTGTEVYARSIINALATSRDTRTMRVYANAVAAPPWLPAGRKKPADEFLRTLFAALVSTPS